MAEVISIKDYMAARFFPEDVVCAHCEQETRGLVYDSSTCVICSECGAALLVVAPGDFQGFTVVTFESEL